MLRRAHIVLLIGAATLLGAASAAHAASLDPVTQRSCFGAASRDPLIRCIDPALRVTIFPTPDDALLEPNAPCIPSGQTKLLYPCTFGLRRPSASDPTETIALVGDSHASHWRAAVDVVAVLKGLPAVSIARTGCPFIDATVVMARRERTGCRGWNRELKGYLRRHREVSTLFVSHRSSARFETAPGRDNFETQVAGHIALWRSLPASIENIVVIRDTPRGSAAAALCVQRAFSARRAAGRRCARMRSKALHRDPAVVAARRMRSPRVHAIDLSRFFCDARRCFPVVGGALVHKDVDHITAVFARTLGRYLLRAYDDILQASGASPLDGLIADERAAAECLIAERRAAARAGGWDKLPPERLELASSCRALLLQRAAELRALGLSDDRDLAHRYAVILAVLYS